MLAIGTLTNLQRGTLWGGFVKAFLIGQSQLIQSTVHLQLSPYHNPMDPNYRTTTPDCHRVDNNHHILLDPCRAASDACVSFRTLFVNGGTTATLESIDFVFRAMQLRGKPNSFQSLGVKTILL
ncbi:hypothetical protein FRB95_014527 [Tulasnella sp. JGI-2019a]|nr:hypothetical protein FRB95_014527 [Tulasnella sp. JGI-2019a]